ncbi:MAG: gamma-glutamyltransferase [Acidobacteriota bacterium]
MLPWIGLLAAVAGAREPVHGRSGMVVSSMPIATDLGVEVLKRGGTAADAAVATAFALAVVLPQAGNIGGGGFAVFRDGRDGSLHALDFRETAPERSTPFMFVDEHGDVIPERSTIGIFSAGAPGSVAGLWELHASAGKLPWKDLVEPSVRLAAEGFPVDWRLARDVVDERKRLTRFPETAAIFYPGGQPISEGTILKQPDLARTLAIIRDRGRSGFYDGEVRDLVVAASRKYGGLLQAADLVGYHAVARDPIRCRWRDLELVTMPPPSSGGTTLLEILNVLEPFHIGELGPRGAMEASLIAEASRMAFVDRSRYLGDPAYTHAPVAGLTSKAYAARLRAMLAPGHPRETQALMRVLPEPADTTHLATADASGGVVALTTTINDLFGSGLVVERGGFLLNDEMDDFVARPGAPNLYGLTGGIENSPQPGKRMLSSMCPTIVMKDGKPWLVLGAAGGPRIITTVLEVLLNVVEHGMNVADAVDLPRIHHQGSPDELLFEPRGLSAETQDELCRMGYKLKAKETMSDSHAIEVTSGGFRGAADPRYAGSAAGF